MLSLVVVMLIGLIAVASHYQITVTKYVSLFPVIILTGMMERFWTLEEEDGARSSFRTLIGTLVIAAAVALVVSASWISTTLGHYPEALGLVMAGQLLLGRYTGYRVAELYRFRDFVATPRRSRRSRSCGGRCRFGGFDWPLNRKRRTGRLCSGSLARIAFATSASWG